VYRMQHLRPEVFLGRSFYAGQDPRRIRRPERRLMETVIFANANVLDFGKCQKITHNVKL